MIQLLDLMILFVGLYVITKMAVYIFRDDIKMATFGIVITKLMAGTTIIITIICVLLALLSFVGTLDTSLLQ